MLQLCLSSTSCKHGAPTIDHLLQHPLFANARVNGLSALPPHETRIHLKFPLPLKEELKAAVASVEARLKNEQKLVCVGLNFHLIHVQIAEIRITFTVKN